MWLGRRRSTATRPFKGVTGRVRWIGRERLLDAFDGPLDADERLGAVEVAFKPAWCGLLQRSSRANVGECEGVRPARPHG